MARGPGKGNTNNPAGKPKGTKSYKTRQWEELGEKIIGSSAERFEQILDKLDDKEFAKYYLMILEYFKPKQQRTEIQADVKSSVDFSTMTTEELKERADALIRLHESPNTDIA